MSARALAFVLLLALLGGGSGLRMECMRALCAVPAVVPADACASSCCPHETAESEWELCQHEREIALLALQTQLPDVTAASVPHSSQWLLPPAQAPPHAVLQVIPAPPPDPILRQIRSWRLTI